MGHCLFFFFCSHTLGRKEATRSPFYPSVAWRLLGMEGTSGGSSKISAGVHAATGSCCSQLLKSQTQMLGAPQPRPPDAHA